MDAFRADIFFIALAAALAPLLARLPTEYRMPVVVVEILLGIFIGPHILNLVSPDGLVGMLGELGLTFLLFMVGMEINLGDFQSKPLKLAIGGWCLSLLVAMVCMYFVHAIGLIQGPPLLAAVALSTTALGIVAPILKDEGILDTDFGRLLLSAAAMGELGPLMVISLLLIPNHNAFLHTMFVVAFIGITFVIANMLVRARTSYLTEVFTKTMQHSGQLPVRLCILLQALLVVLAGEFGLNVVIGAFAAGMLVSLAGKNEGGLLLREKLDAIGYGFLIPFFFIVAGMKFDLSALWSDPLVPVQIICLLGLLILIRGAPVLLYNQVLSSSEKLPFALYSATGLPLMVVISEFGVSSGLMTQNHATVLVSAGMISVMAFPIFAARLRMQSS